MNYCVYGNGRSTCLPSTTCDLSLRTLFRTYGPYIEPGALRFQGPAAGVVEPSEALWIVSAAKCAPSVGADVLSSGRQRQQLLHMQANF